MPKLTWSARENYTTYPFPISELALDNVELKLGHEDDNEFSSQENRRINQIDYWENANPQISFKVNEEILSTDTGIPREEIDISLIVRDRRLNQFKKIKTWPLGSLPSRPIGLSHELSDFSWSESIDLAVVATLTKSCEKSDLRASQKGAVLATKTFKVRLLGQSLNIPRKLVEPEEFERISLDRQTIWHVHWIGEDLQKPPDELLEIWINKEYEDKYLGISASSSSTANYISESIGAGILLEIFSVVLNDEDNDLSEPTSLISRVMHELEMDLDEARRVFGQKEGFSALRSRCWKGANIAFSSLKF